MKPGLEPRALGFLNLEPAPSPLKARAKPCLGPGLGGPGRAWLRALSPARHITNLFKCTKSSMSPFGYGGTKKNQTPVSATSSIRAIWRGFRI